MDMFNPTRVALGVCVVMAVALSTGCSFSSFETARNLPRGGTSITGAIASYGYHSDQGGDSEIAFEAAVSHGLSEKVELGGKLAFFNIEDNKALNVLFTEKFSLAKDSVALTIPAGIILTDGDNVWMVNPGVLATYPATKDFTIEGAAKLVINLQDDFGDSNTLIAANVGLRLSPGGNTTWGLQPEIGFAIDPNEEGYFLQFGFGFVYNIGARPPDDGGGGGGMAGPAPAPGAWPAP